MTDIKISETCNCGASIDVTSPTAKAIVEGWRKSHAHGTPADKSTGTGFTVSSLATSPREPYGHARLNFRA